ncbi:MAG: hypothetical protein RBT69_11110 [Spirochaetia bacterium]|nr:hypothetical protein [Spirochaetia bacterium]
MKKSVFLLFAAALVFLSGILSCTSVPYSQWNSSSAKIVDLVNSREDISLSELTYTPFLLDREIIIPEKDISMIWKNISESGFTFEEASEIGSIPIGAGDYSYFADTMEVRTWFSKYLPEKASLVKVDAKNGLYYFILGPKKWITPQKEEPEISIGYSLGMGSHMMMRLDEDKTGGSKKKSYPSIYGFTGPVTEGGEIK